MPAAYEELGRQYGRSRQTDHRIAAAIRAALGDSTTLVNVGAGTGSYEPADLHTIAVEPAWQMITQRSRQDNVVQAYAESLPLRSQQVDAALAVLTIHHWADLRRGLAECWRVARRRIVVLTWDPHTAGFWLVQEYFPDLLALDQRIFPPLDLLTAELGRSSVQVLPIPHNCSDGFLGAYWRRPWAYLEDTVRAGMSSFARIDAVAPRLAQLQRDLERGVWQQRHSQLLAQDSLDLGYRLIVAERS